MNRKGMLERIRDVLRGGPDPMRDMVIAYGIMASPANYTETPFRGPGAQGYAQVLFNGREYVRCLRCGGYGRTHWAHGDCGHPGNPTGNWFQTIHQLEWAGAAPRNVQAPGWQPGAGERF